MKNRIIVEKVIQDVKTIKYQYKIEGEIKKYINYDIEYSIEYSENIENIPYGIAVIPLVANFLPLIWLLDAEINIDEIDERFYESLPYIKEGYQKMYSMLEFGGKIDAKYIKKKLDKNYSATKSGTFFSGGADAFTTLMQHKKDISTLITIWGADISVNNISGWENVKKFTEKIGSDFDLDCIFIKTNFRNVINECALDRLVKVSGDGWWHGFQCGVSMIAQVVPVAVQKCLKEIYIASSFSREAKGKYTCASDPTIDNFIEFCNSQIIHDGYNYSRQDKIHFLCEYANERNIKIPLRVCWESKDGKNCNYCEKCCRTIMEIVVEGANPNDFGFQWDYKAIKKFKKKIYEDYYISEMNFEALWVPMLNKLRENQVKIANYKAYEWLVDIKLEDINNAKIKKITQNKIYKKALKCFYFLGEKI